MSEQDRAMDVLDELLQVEGGLSAWEIDFLDDMNNKRNLIWSDKQIGKLDKIWEKVN